MILEIMNNRITLLFIAAGILIGINSGAHAQDSLTVMSYNIMHGEQPYDGGEGNLDDIAALIDEVNPDFVALQEVDEMTGRIAALNNGQPFSFIDSLAKVTGMKGYFGQTIDFEGGAYGIGLLTRTALEFHKIALPNPGDGEPRAVLFVQAETSDGQPFIFASTHLDFQFAENQKAQVEKVNEVLLTKDQPVIIAGDFNLTPDTDYYQILQEKWIDAAIAFDENPEPTFPANGPNRRIDYLFLSKQDQWEVINIHTVDVQFSDHIPLVAKVVLYSD